jgi:hypothetical protein
MEYLALEATLFVGGLLMESFGDPITSFVKKDGCCGKRIDIEMTAECFGGE